MGKRFTVAVEQDVYEALEATALAAERSMSKTAGLLLKLALAEHPNPADFAPIVVGKRQQAGKHKRSMAMDTSTR